MPIPSFFKKFNCASSRSGDLPKRKKSFKKNSKPESPAQVNQASQNFNSFNPDVVNATNVQNQDRKYSVSTVEDEEISFWDIGNYKYTLRRCDNGHKLGSELIEMLSDRAKIEEDYAKSLKQWSKKWNSHLDKDSAEFDTTKLGWKAMLDVGNQTADIHLDMCKNILNKPVQKIKDWLKTKYSKSYINFKQTKEFENEFEMAEKSWNDLFEKLKKSKKEYYDWVKTAKQSDENVKQAQSNPKYTVEQRSKLEDKFKKAKEEEERARKRYQNVLAEMDLFKPTHVNRMTEVYEKTQNFEQERILFFKQTFFECHDLFQIHNDERLEEIFGDTSQQINLVNPEFDLDYWTNKYGVGTKPNWPAFEEYQSS